jgi:hypothetical protein
MPSTMSAEVFTNSQLEYEQHGNIGALGTAYALTREDVVFEEIVDVDGKPLTFSNQPRRIGFY